jgi:hypothetical protein
MKRSISYLPSFLGGEIARTTILYIKSRISFAKSIDSSRADEKIIYVISSSFFVIPFYTSLEDISSGSGSSALLLTIPPFHHAP